MKKRNILWFIALIVITIFLLFPFFQMLSTSLKPPDQQFTIPVNFFPQTFTLKNYIDAVKFGNFARYFINSLSVSSLTVISATLIALFGSYGFTRLQFPGRRFMLILILFSQMFCLAAIVIPLYRILGNLDLVNTYQGLLIGFLTFTVPTGIWLFRSFIIKIPISLEEAAYVEGATKLGAFWKITVPLLKPAFGAVSAYVFILSWQDFLFPLVIMNDEKYRTLSVGIMDFVGQYETNWGSLMAASVIITLPVLVLFLFLQRQLISGLVEGAIKE